MQAIDSVASIIIKQLVPGRTRELKMGDNIMLLTKNYAHLMTNQSFSFSPISGFHSGLTVRIQNTIESGELASSDEILGLRVST
jgi:hypothetical protein